MGKLAIKRLTGSDLTLFEWQFRNRNAGNQKSINLNADVFIDQLYPALPNTDVGRAGRIPMDLFLYGPGNARAWNLQRKIIKGGTYKNWRLDGEYIPNPLETPARFNVLVPGDYAIFDFEGELFPTEARIVFVAAAVAEDANLHAGLTDFGVGSMRAIQLPDLSLIVHASGTPEIHPVYELLLDAAIEDAAQGGIQGTQRLLTRRTGRRLTRTELERARQRASDVGRQGEELMDGYFAIELRGGSIQEVEWISNENAISPFDFWITIDGQRSKVEVKATSGDFNQVMHVSIAELLEMRDSPERYDLYRVYGLDERRGRLRIAENVRDFAAQILESLAGLPAGVTSDGVSIRPDSMGFGAEGVIELPSNEDDENDTA